jgi:hypothetical protein
MLNSQFPHLPMARSNDSRRVWKRQRRAMFHKQLNDAANIHLFVVVEIKKS